MHFPPTLASPLKFRRNVARGLITTGACCARSDIAEGSNLCTFLATLFSIRPQRGHRTLFSFKAGSDKLGGGQLASAQGPRGLLVGAGPGGTSLYHTKRRCEEWENKVIGLSIV